MCGKSKGFTLIEILVVIALIGLLTTIVVPAFKRRSPHEERRSFIAQLNSLTRFSWQQALITRKLQAVVFDMKKRHVRVEQSTGAVKDGKPQLEQIKRAYIRTSLELPKQLQIQNFIIEGFDEMSRFGARPTEEVFFYIVPDGLTQAVTINLIDTKDLNAAKKPRQVGLVLNPFTAQFTTHASFQK